MHSELVRNPVYQQLHDLLRTLIRKGDFPCGGKFLTEREISLRYGVSRATANKVLSGLVSEGFLEFRKGVGTFVRHRPLDYDLRRLVSFEEKARAVGKRPTTRVLEFQVTTVRHADAVVRDALQCAAATDDDVRLYYLERLRLADGVPVIFERRFVPERLCPQLSRTDVGGSLYEAWTTKCGLLIGGAEETIRAVGVSLRQAELLEIEPGGAGLLVTSTGYTADGAALWWEETLYRAAAYEFRNRLGGVSPSGGAVGGLT